MILWIAVIVLLVLWPGTTNIKLRGYFADYLEQDKTLAIKGIFVMLIFASHFVGYVELSPTVLNTAYTRFKVFMGQLVVVPFLFYSGYGIAIQAQRRGDAYVRDLPRNRIRKVFLQFWFALLLFFIVGCLQGKRFTAKQVLLSMVGWTTLGNSNWYVLMIICLYVISYTALRITQRPITVLILVWSGCLIYSIWQKSYNRPAYCYNTVFAYWIGMFYSYYKDVIDRKIIKRDSTFWAIILLKLILFFMLHRIWRTRTLFYDLTSVCFAWLLVMVTSRIQIHNCYFTFMGKHVFSIYILQRIPMIIFQSHMRNVPIVFFGVSLIATILLSISFDRITSKI